MYDLYNREVQFDEMLMSFNDVLDKKKALRQMCDALLSFFVWKLRKQDTDIRTYIDKKGGYLVMDYRIFRTMIRDLTGLGGKTDEYLNEYLKDNPVFVSVSEEEMKRYENILGTDADLITEVQRYRNTLKKEPDYIRIVDPSQVKHVLWANMCERSDILMGPKGRIFVGGDKLAVAVKN